MQHTRTRAPDAHLLITSSCSHCATQLQYLADLVKTGELGKLTIENLEQRPELAKQFDIKSVPFLILGPFQFTGVQNVDELRRWISQSQTSDDIAPWFAELMSHREVERVIGHLKSHPDDFTAILSLLSDPDTELVARIGIGVVMETFAGDKLLQKHFNRLAALCQHDDPRVRADACHYVGLSGDSRVIETLLAHQSDSDADVRESVKDALEELGYRHH